MNGLMAGKRGLIMGLANDKSLAWGIAKALHAARCGTGDQLSGRCHARNGSSRWPTASAAIS